MQHRPQCATPQITHEGRACKQVFDTPGHTKGHITFWIPGADALFPDLLFGLATALFQTVKLFGILPAIIGEAPFMGHEPLGLPVSQ
eukprot:1152321-Pelagomonas_calceolata.AAC.9